LRAIPEEPEIRAAVISRLRVVQIPAFFTKFEEFAFPNLQYVNLRTDNGNLVRCGPGEEGNPQGTAMSQLLVRFVKNQSGATAIEYGLIAAGISIAIIAVVNGLGTQLNTTFSSVSTQLK
jgi:pilus assembly protein Flp/PilA